MTPQQIVNEAFRLGRNLEAHIVQIHSDPDNYDRVCDHVAEQMQALKEQLQTLCRST